MINKCIDSWRRYCLDYEIVEWNEENFDINMFPYTKEAYSVKKWAFVSDYARLYAVYSRGGIYLDTDVELLHPIDNLLNNAAWFVFQNDISVNMGIGFGADRNNSYVKKMMNYYENNHFIVKGKPNLSIGCPAINTEILKSIKDFVLNGKTQYVSQRILVLSEMDYAKYVKHYGAMSWIEGVKPVKKVYKNLKIKEILRSQKYFEFVEKYFGRRMNKIYTFIVFDLFELGFVYYIRRLIWKMKH